MKKLYILILSCYCALNLSAQDQWKFNTKLNFFFADQEKSVVLVVPKEFQELPLNIRIGLEGRLCFLSDTVAHEPILRLPVDQLSLDLESGQLVIWISGPMLSIELRTSLIILPRKAHSVQVDRETGSLIIGDRPFFPFGFYCYSPVQPYLAEQEVVKGFNMMSPYQKIEGKTLPQRLAYLDRCAELGMKVHYNLLSVAGGGGVGSARTPNISKTEKYLALQQEVLAIKDHPALMAWYISDEPTGHGEDPDSLKEVYDLIKTLDPYHPVTIVFMAPMQARKYADAMDIVMADPYPVPNQPIRSVGTVTTNLINEFYAEKPVWLVPQAFGGGEHWGREPSARELRAMTYMSLIEGATGIQYFVRHGPNGFPKSTSAWGECGKISLEVQEMMMFLLNGIDIPNVSSNVEQVRVRAWEHQGDIMIMAVNTVNQPLSFSISTPMGLEGAEVDLIFEQRKIVSSSNEIYDIIDGYGSRVYLIHGFSGSEGVHPLNLIMDPGFEDISNPGVPASCYARVGGDPGSTYFLDTREVKQGHHSIRVVTPKARQGIGLSFFPVRLNSGSGYTLSIWAKYDPQATLPVKKNFWQNLFRRAEPITNSATISLENLVSRDLELSADWKEYKIHFLVPNAGSDPAQMNISLRLNSQGTAWFDLLEIYPDPVIHAGLNTESGRFEVTAETSDPLAILRYSLDGSIPALDDPEYMGPVVLTKTSKFTVGIFVDNQLKNYASQDFLIHLGTGQPIDYRTKYYGKYDAGGAFGLVDGLRGSRNYLDGRWQGFLASDMAATIAMPEKQFVEEVTIGCLQDTRSWIFMPEGVEVFGSLDGEEFFHLGGIENPIDEKASGAILHDFVLKFTPIELSHVRVIARNIGLCPDWHNGKGKAAYVFVDEIIIK